MAQNFPATFRLDGRRENVSFTTAAGTMATAFGLGVTRARIVATTACYIAQGKSPTATTSDVLLPANVIEYITVNPGEKLSAIRSSADGSLNVTEV